MRSVHMPCNWAYGRGRTFRLNCRKEILQRRRGSSDYPYLAWCSWVLSLTWNSPSGHQTRKPFDKIKWAWNLFSKNCRLWFGKNTSWRIASWNSLWHTRLCGTRSFETETIWKGVWLLEHRGGGLHNAFWCPTFLFRRHI